MKAVLLVAGLGLGLVVGCYIAVQLTRDWERTRQEKTFWSMGFLIWTYDTGDGERRLEPLPSTIEELYEQAVASGLLEYSYSLGAPPQDVWGHPIRIVTSGDGFILWSVGRDGVPQFETPPSDCMHTHHPDDDILLLYKVADPGVTCIRAPYTNHGCWCARGSPEGRSWYPGPTEWLRALRGKYAQVRAAASATAAGEDASAERRR